MLQGYSRRPTSHLTLTYEYTHKKTRSLQHGKKTGSSKGRSSYPWQSLLYQQVLSGKGMVGPEPKTTGPRVTTFSPRADYFNASSRTKADERQSAESKSSDVSKASVITKQKNNRNSNPRQTDKTKRPEPHVKMTTMKEDIHSRDAETDLFLKNQDREEKTQRREKEQVRRHSKSNSNQNHGSKLHRKRNRKEKKHNRKSSAIQHVKHDEVPVFVPRQTSESNKRKHHGAMHSSNNGREHSQRK